MSTDLSRRGFLFAAAVSGAAAAVGPSSGDAPEQHAEIGKVKALAFDVFGTVVDWRTSVIREGQFLTATKGVQLDWPKFADEWREGYRSGIARIRRGESKWANVDEIHREKLDELVRTTKIRGLSPADLEHFNLVWHRLMPWPDSVAGLTRLRARYIVSTLSNGNVSLLVNMAKNAGLPWDCVLSSEMSGHYKTDPEVYQTGARLLGLKPHEVMMVAAHANDILAARAAGMRTAFIMRPLEFGPTRKADEPPAADVVATDLLDLATRLGA